MKRCKFSFCSCKGFCSALLSFREALDTYKDQKVSLFYLNAFKTVLNDDLVRHSIHKDKMIHHFMVS